MSDASHFVRRRAGASRSGSTGVSIQQRGGWNLILMIQKIMRRPNWLGTVLLWSCAMALAQVPPDGIAPVKAALQRGDFDGALQLLDPKLKTSPRSPQLWTLLGLAYQAKGDPKKALDSFQEALKNASDYLPALEGAAKIEYDSEDQ